MNPSKDLLVELVPTNTPSCFLGVLTLNSQKNLNALSFEMLQGIFSQLLNWRDNSQVVAVVLRGAGDRAFCAGGNIKSLYEFRSKTHFSHNFFSTEYTTDYFIHKYPKPVIAFTHGITMGGGLGLSRGASFRVATQNTILAMPEISIGLFPDVGAFWFLNKISVPGLGLFLALTGARLNFTDAINVGLVTHGAQKTDFDVILEKLRNIAWSKSFDSDSEKINSVLNSFRADKSAAPQSVLSESVLDRLKLAQKSESARDWRNFYSKQDSLTEWELQALEFFDKGSPLSIGATFQRFKQAQSIELFETFQKDYAMAVRFYESGEFTEGTRALLIDKDSSPQWNPKNLNQLSNMDLKRVIDPAKDSVDFDYFLNFVVSSGYLKEWKISKNKIKRDFVFSDFKQCFKFMSLVADLAEQQNHHPEWSNVYNRLTIELTTHDADPDRGGAITEKDLDMATKIDSLSLSFF